MNNLPTLRQMQYLLAVAAHQSFKKAAEDCAVTQSTLSGGIMDMESILQSPVIDRTSRKAIKFTPLGDTIIRDAKKIISSVEEITHRANNLNKPLSWPVRLGIIPTIAPYFLPLILKKLQKKLPSLQLHIHEMKSQDIMEKLHGGDIDLALMAFPYDTGVFDQEILFEEKFVCAAPPDYFKDKKTIDQSDLEGEKLLLLEDGHCLRDHALAACKFIPQNDLKTFSAASLSTLIQLVHQGYGLTLLPQMVVLGNNMLPENLTIRPFSSGGPTRKVGFCYKNGGFRAKDVEIVTSTIIKIISTPSKD